MKKKSPSKLADDQMCFGCDRKNTRGLQLPAVTAELRVRFRRPAQVGESLHCEARVSKEESRIFRMEADAKTSTGELIASATARCVRV